MLKKYISPAFGPERLKSIDGSQLMRAMICAALLMLIGCESATRRQLPLVVGTNTWPGYEPLYLARNLNFFDPKEVRLAEYISATQVLAAFRNRTVDAAAVTLDEALLLRESGIDICVILVMDISHGADVILAQPGAGNLQALEGLRIGVENTAVGAYVLTRAFQEGGISPDSVTIVPREVDEHERAVETDEVDAVVTFEPVRSRLLAQGMVEVFNSAMIPGEILDVLVVRRESIDLQQARLITLLEAWFKAADYLRDHPVEATARMAKRVGLSAEELQDSYTRLIIPDRKKNMEMLDGPAPSLLNISARLSSTMKDNGLLRPGTRIDGLASSTLLSLLEPDE